MGHSQSCADLIEASFTTTPPKQAHFTPPESISLRWTFQRSANPFRIEFEKLDASTGAYDLFVEHIVVAKRTMVHWNPARIDLQEQATFRINDTTAADAGQYRCTVNTVGGGNFQSTVQLSLRGKSVRNMCFPLLYEANCINY